MGFAEFCRCLGLAAACSGVALGLLVLIASLFFPEATLNLNLDFDLDLATGLWAPIVLPLLLLVLALVLAPLSYLLYRLWRLARRRVKAVP